MAESNLISEGSTYHEALLQDQNRSPWRHLAARVTIERGGGYAEDGHRYHSDDIVHHIAVACAKSIVSQMLDILHGYHRIPKSIAMWQYWSVKGKHCVVALQTSMCPEITEKSL